MTPIDLTAAADLPYSFTSETKVVPLDLALAAVAAAALAAPSAGPPAPIAGVTAIYCGWGCSCVTQCGDTYDYAGQPKPPLRPAAPAQPPAAEPWHLLKHRILPPGTAPTSSLHWGDEQAAAPSVEAEPVQTTAGEVERLREDCAEAYQVVGALSSMCGLFGTGEVEKVLDNLHAATCGEPRPHATVLPFAPAAAQTPAALETCQNCGDLPYPGCSSEFQGEPSCRFWPAAAPAVEAEPVAWGSFFPSGVCAQATANPSAAEGWRRANGDVRPLFLAAPLQQPQEGWVSVDERLPEKFVEVLVAFADSSLPSTGQYTANPNDHDGWCYPKENCDWMDGSWPTVTHWMPLPDHPHEELFAPPAATNQNGAGDA